MVLFVVAGLFILFLCVCRIERFDLIWPEIGGASQGDKEMEVALLIT